MIRVPTPGAGDRRDARDDAQHLRKGERDEGEIRALESGTERERADRGADQSTGGDAEREATQALTP